ncbi:MAG: ferric reductase-like transmembrane domain-containing protein [Caldilineaceae bacterium]|nr:ferric reductase-like transmembrane domain-containing protein [Caldilineaceae bacterium]
MNYSLGRLLLWIVFYVVMAISPMLIAYVGPLPLPRSFWVELSVGLGFVGLAIMGLQFVLTGRFQRVAASLGLDSMLQFHRQSGLIAFFFILAHPLLLFVTNPGYLVYLDPRVNLPRALALSAVLGALVLLIVTTLWRRTAGLRYEWWRVIHGVLALFVLFIGLVHILQVGFYVSTPWKQALWIAMTGGAMLLLINTRVLRPLQMRRNPYYVTAVREERGRAWTLVLAPDGHEGMRFAAGQFVWLTLGDSPFSLQQHPFSISSSAEQHDRIELTIKALGDFTSTMHTVEPGTRAYLEGPYGAFTLDPTSNQGAVFIVGGVGITPIMSMLRTLRDRGDQRPLLLIYGNSDWESVLFQEELALLQQALNLEVVHVLQNPPEGWQGETGLISKEILGRWLPDEIAKNGYFVCGPEPMMDMVEPYLSQHGVPLRKIFSERFSIV